MLVRTGWKLTGPRTLRRFEAPVDPVPPDHALVRVVGCGLCHTDVGFYTGEVRPRHALPLVLGHEIAGYVAEGSGSGAALYGEAVVVPAVMPCGRCELCLRDRGGICTRQVMPGNDIDGGFASFVTVPADGLCVVPHAGDADHPLGVSGITLRELAVVADAVSTPYQAARNARLHAGEVAIVVGVGGVGGYAVQVAKALGANVVALDVREERRAVAAASGADVVLEANDDAKRAVRRHVAERGWPATEWKIFECSGHPKGQELAFSLLTPGATLAVVGFTREAVPVRLSNLMALEAVAVGTWGCLPRHYPDIVELVLEGRIKVRPHVELHSLEDLPALLDSTPARRPILVPPESV